MPERLSSRKETIPPPNNPHESANYQGEFDKLFLHRIQSPQIKQQVINLMLESGSEKDAKRAAKSFTESLKNAKRWPKLVPGEGPSGTSKIFVDNISSVGRPLTPHEITMVAAHEKGHLIRSYAGGWFAQYFLRGFDTSKVEFTEDDHKEYLQYAIKSGFLVDDENDEEKSRWATKEEIEAMNPFEVVKDRYISGLFNGLEIAERMAQLKNYFGMKANEIFTAEHLKVARARYLVDLPGCNNSITQFFQAITPETEERFLYLINNSGI